MHDFDIECVEISGLTLHQCLYTWTNVCFHPIKTLMFSDRCFHFLMILFEAIKCKTFFYLGTQLDGHRVMNHHCKYICNNSFFYGYKFCILGPLIGIKLSDRSLIFLLPYFKVSVFKAFTRRVLLLKISNVKKALMIHPPKKLFCQVIFIVVSGGV